MNKNESILEISWSATRPQSNKSTTKWYCKITATQNNKAFITEQLDITETNINSVTGELKEGAITVRIETIAEFYNQTSKLTETSTSRPVTATQHVCVTKRPTLQLECLTCSEYTKDDKTQQSFQFLLLSLLLSDHQ